jgi:succinate--hydroxymethylglutarate CoA-transferase
VKHPRAGKVKLVRPPVTYNGKKMEVRMPPPWLSQHTMEVCVFLERELILVLIVGIFCNQIMEELEYTSEEIESLRKRSII